MRALLQRVQGATVKIDNKVQSKIGCGLLVLLGIEHSDSLQDIDYLINKIVNIRLFKDSMDVMNHSVLNIHGEIMVVSQFTLQARTKKGNRPSYINAAKPEIAIPLYNTFIERLQKEVVKNVKTGTFGADMQIELINDGPVTIWLDSKQKE